ncbi:MAG: tryptophan--tRNA ligase [Acidobacteriota bacterium]
MILSTVTPLGLMERMTQYKEKTDEDAAKANLGLFSYPVLQAADILLYKADTVPVGEDQAQHLEVTRDIARKFNLRFGATFPEPKTLLSPAPRVIGLDGTRKMSKSLGNHIALADPAEVVKKKLSVAVTDPARKRRSDPGNPDVCNIYALHKFFSKPDEIAMVDVECRRAGIGCLDCKGILARNVSAELAPIQDRRAALLAKPDGVKEILRAASSDLAPIARATLDEVRSKVGVGS